MRTQQRLPGSSRTVILISRPLRFFFFFGIFFLSLKIDLAGIPRARALIFVTGSKGKSIATPITNQLCLSPLRTHTPPHIPGLHLPPSPFQIPSGKTAGKRSELISSVPKYGPSLQFDHEKCFPRISLKRFTG